MTDTTPTNTGLTTVLEVISDKWAMPIIRAISAGHNRFGLLKAQLPDVSKKMLTQTLRRLERNGVILRIDYDEVPPHVEYEITELGTSLGEQLTPLCQWGDQNGEDIEAVRHVYDTVQDSEI